jgi:hypothetical protein
VSRGSQAGFAGKIGCGPFLAGACLRWLASRKRWRSSRARGLPVPPPTCLRPCSPTRSATPPASGSTCLVSSTPPGLTPASPKDQRITSRWPKVGTVIVLGSGGREFWQRFAEACAKRAVAGALPLPQQFAGQCVREIAGGVPHAKLAPRGASARRAMPELRPARRGRGFWYGLTGVGAVVASRVRAVGFVARGTVGGRAAVWRHRGRFDHRPLPAVLQLPPAMLAAVSPGARCGACHRASERRRRSR